MIKVDSNGHTQIVFGQGTVGITAGHEIGSNKPLVFLHEITKGEDIEAYVGRYANEMPAGSIRLQFSGAESAISLIRQIVFAFKEAKSPGMVELNTLLKYLDSESKPLY